MTPKEMYIQVLNDLSALASQRTRKFHPEQIELELNAEIGQYVTDAVSENQRGYFTVDSEFYDGIQTLIETSSIELFHAGASQKALVPLNSQKILDVLAFGGYTGSLPVSKTTQSLYYFTLALEPQPYRKVELRLGDVVLYKRDGTTGYTTNDTHNLINELVAAVPGLSWETAYNNTFSSKLVYVSRINGSLKLVVDGVTVEAVLAKTETYDCKTISKNIGVTTRRLKNQMKAEGLHTPYYKPSSLDIPVVLQRNALEVHTPENYIVNSVLLTYIRRPRKMSLSLNIGCDLDPSCHAQICDRTVQRIRERIGDPKLQTGNTI
jgi:hypothetical protein